jgi:hypothetical protein
MNEKNNYTTYKQFLPFLLVFRFFTIFIFNILKNDFILCKVKFLNIEANMMQFLKRHFVKTSVLLFSCYSIAGCWMMDMMPPFGVHPGLALAGIETVTLINSDRTLSDHMVSAYKNQDCSIVRSAEGGEYCVDLVKPPHNPPKIYCYRTIGDVSCYDRPLEGYQPVDFQ